MSYSIVLKIEHSGMMYGRGYWILPVLPPPKKYGFKLEDAVEILLPDGTRKVYSANFGLEHFNRFPRPGEWRYVIILPNATKDDVPEGSKIFLSEETINRLELG